MTISIIGRDDVRDEFLRYPDEWTCALDHMCGSPGFAYSCFARARVCVRTVC